MEICRENYRYCRPWTASFLTDLAHVHAAAFHRPLEVSSAVRTVEYQKRLMETNGNAAAAEGDIASPHLTGATIDIVKHGMSRQEMAWMRSRLLRLQQANMIKCSKRSSVRPASTSRSIKTICRSRRGQPENQSGTSPRSRFRLQSGLGKGIPIVAATNAKKLIAQHQPFKGTIAAKAAIG